MNMDNIDDLEYFCSAICDDLKCANCEIGIVLDKYHSTLELKNNLHDDLYDEHLDDNLPF